VHYTVDLKERHSSEVVQNCIELRTAVVRYSPVEVRHCTGRHIAALEAAVHHIDPLVEVLPSLVELEEVVRRTRYTVDCT
jgi:hypothetical protein